MFKLFKSENERNVAKLEKIAKVIESKADYYQGLTDEELKGTKSVLNAAALTYVAALLVSILNFLRFVFYILINRSRD